MSTNASTSTTVINLTIDGKAVAVPKGTTVYTAAKGLGIDIPIFCYQDRMPPFGACRMCLVEVEKMPKLQASCTLEAAEGMVVKTQSQMALDGREGILEFLLINHPLDCPICDRGGECPLQDQTLKHGPGESRFFEEKRHFTKALPLGPVLMLDRERCIVCARCTRFGEVIAGDHALEFIERGYRTEVGTPGGRPVESKFIGNTIMICPVGALTSQAYRFRARPWDNDQTPTTCTLCPVGCSMVLDSRDGEIMRTRPCENRDINDIWLCDKGWFGYEFVDHPERLQQPMIRRADKLEPASWAEALSVIADKLREAQGKEKVAGFGGDSLTTEEAYLFQQFITNTGGASHVDHRIGTPIFSSDEEGLPPGMEMSIGESAQLKYAVLCGLDLTEEFPVIWLRLKQAINDGAKVLFVGHYAPEIKAHLSETVLHAPGLELDALEKHVQPFLSSMAPDQKGAIFVGRQYLASPQRTSILAELVKLTTGRAELQLNVMEGHGNSFGSRVAGMRPDIGPLGVKRVKPGLSAIQVLETARQNGWDYLHVAGADPASKFPSKLWSEARAKIKCLVVQDIFLTETARQADVVLPTLCYVEKTGSFINIEWRVQKINPGKDIPSGIYSDAQIFALISEKLGQMLVIDPEFSAKLTGRLQPARPEHIVSGQVAGLPVAEGMLRATFVPMLFDRGVRMKHNVHLSQMTKDPRVRISPAEGARRSLEDGDRVRLYAKEQTIAAKVVLDAGVAEGTVLLPIGFKQLPIKELGPQLWNGLGIELKKEV